MTIAKKGAEHQCAALVLVTVSATGHFYAALATPNLSDAILVPSTRDLIFWNAISRATSGEPCFGFTSMLKGEKPQSSVEPSRSFGMYFEASAAADAL